MKYILTVLAAALTLSACCTKQCPSVHAHGKVAKADKCCSTGQTDCCKKH